MAFVKLDTGILTSTIWVERECRELFITALLMAQPKEFLHPVETIKIRSTERDEFTLPAGWYGFVPAASMGIARMAMVDFDVALDALERLAGPDPNSRTPDHDGRRMVRVNGGFVILNFMKYRDMDHTSAARSKRYRERQKAIQDRHNASRDEHHDTRDSRLADADADADAIPKVKNKKQVFATKRRTRVVVHETLAPDERTITGAAVYDPNDDL